MRPVKYKLSKDNIGMMYLKLDSFPLLTIRFVEWASAIAWDAESKAKLECKFPKKAVSRDAVIVMEYIVVAMNM